MRLPVRQQSQVSSNTHPTDRLSHAPLFCGKWWPSRAPRLVLTILAKSRRVTIQAPIGAPRAASRTEKNFSILNRKLIKEIAVRPVRSGCVQRQASSDPRRGAEVHLRVARTHVPSLAVAGTLPHYPSKIASRLPLGCECAPAQHYKIRGLPGESRRRYERARPVMAIPQSSGKLMVM